jgi:DnaJ-class molecular chaperone
MPCRGTGKVISNLGGTASSVTCPWCEGSGARIPGIDAQAKWLGNEPQDTSETEDSAATE